ncbi:MAG: type VI secretion system protein TssL, short form [Paucimonas sp.]|jgi:type VI secretion system protein ImpK|nr:type VI secretion system protein TssL, short form [Paucimonas sp.]
MSRREMKGVDIDALLQDTYLLVVEVGNGVAVSESEALWARCLELVEGVRERLREAGLGQRSTDLISHAQCALLDESVLGKCSGNEHASWAKESLQVRLFNSHQAGESLYEQMREVLAEPAPDPRVLTVFQRVLVLGFQGRYKQHDDPERLRLVAALEERVAPLRCTQAWPRGTSRGSRLGRVWSRSPWRHGFSSMVLIGAVWCGLDLYLADLVDRLKLPGQG